MTKREKERIMQVVRDGIEAGELQTELHREIAPLLQAEAGAIVLRGAAQNVRTVVVSPWTLARAAGRCVAIGGTAAYNRGVDIWAANVQRREEKAAKAAKATKATKATPRKRSARKPAVAVA